MQHNLIKAILQRKRDGVDCTEAESAQIKGWLRETLIQIGTDEPEIVEAIQELFPQEYGEHLDEHKIINLTFDEWEEKYKPMQNPLDSNASYNGCMLETYGDEVTHVLKYANGSDEDQRRVWTLYDDGETISSGYHLVNRLGYFITEVPCGENETVDVSDPSEPDPDMKSWTVKINGAIAHEEIEAYTTEEAIQQVQEDWEYENCGQAGAMTEFQQAKLNEYLAQSFEAIETNS